MKAILEFNLDTEDDRDSYKLMNQALGMNLALEDLSGLLREKTKYGHTYKSADEVLEDIREKFFEILNERGVRLE